MKTSAIIRIVVWAVIAMLLLGFLIFGLSGGLAGCANVPLRIMEELDMHGYVTYQDEERFIVGGASISMEGITQIEVDWVDGRVDVELNKGNEISFSETSRRQLDESHMLHYYVNGSRLIIKYCQSRVNLTGVWRSLDKHLTLSIPEGISLERMHIDSVSAQVLYQGPGAQSIDIDTVSGGLRVIGVSAGEIDIESISGEVVVEDSTADKVSVDGVSGSTRLTGCAIGEVSTESISGSVRVEPGAQARRIHLESVSGSVRVSLPENDGFTVRYSSASGSFHSAFPVQSSKKTAVYKDGGMEIELETISGSMHVEME